MNANQKDGGRKGKYWKRICRHKMLAGVLVLTLLVPAVLAPTHPVAVYGYLVARYAPSIIPEVWARSDPGLAEFLISPEQIAHYRTEILEDLLDARGGKLFVIVREPGGKLAQAPIRTWNSFLPDFVPATWNGQLDRKEIPFLGDAVDLWLEDKTILATGHYHPFGGGPSPGDIQAQKFSSLPEVVVSNGIAPMVYMRSRLVPYGGGFAISETLFRSLRTLEHSLHMKPRAITPIPSEPTEDLLSFLAYLRDYAGADLDDQDSVIETIGALYLDFRARYAPVFDRGFTPCAYRDDPDKNNMLLSMMNVQLWVGSMGGSGFGALLAARDAAIQPSAPSAQIRVLLLSGQNNHAWQETTPKLVRLLEQYGSCAVVVLEHPEEMTASLLTDFDVVLSNWNNWGETAAGDWPGKSRDALISAIRFGKGFVSVHAGTSSFYDWDAYHELAITAWDLDTTGHGKRHAFAVSPTRIPHPITAGMAPFTTFDELWHGVPVPPDAEVLATAYSSIESGGTGRDEPILLARPFGEGRSVNFLLGHDVEAMRQPAFGALLARAVRWAATREVAAPKLTWSETAEALTLLRGGETLWQFNYGPGARKPHFHPLRLAGGPTLTADAPEDHPWHHGLWFSWKYLNGVNFWEEDRETGAAAGITSWDAPEIMARADGAATIRMNLRYATAPGEDVLAETRVLEVSAPDWLGACQIDWDSTFEALAPEVLLDRTPIAGETDGKLWGGYAGLSMRFATMGAPEVRWEGGEAPLDTPQMNLDATALDFSGDFEGAQCGMAILNRPGTALQPTPWYVIAQPDKAFFYFSPALLYRAPRVLRQGETLALRYRIAVHGGAWSSGRVREALDSMGAVSTGREPPR